jgi:sensor domain CHASE-containing protein
LLAFILSPSSSSSTALRISKPRLNEKILTSLAQKEISDTKNGVLILPEGIVFLAARPILTSNEEGPVNGTLIFARMVSQDLIQEFSDITHLSINVYPVNDPNLPADVSQILSVLSDGEVHTQALRDDLVGGYTLINDVYRSPAIVMRVDVPRIIYQQGRTGQSIFLLFLFLSGLLVAGGIYFFSRALSSPPLRTSQEQRSG